MKRFMIVFLVALALILPGLAFAQTLGPSTPIAPTAPAVAAPAPAPAPAPVVQPKPFTPLTDSPVWVGMSVDIGTPYTGMIANFNKNYNTGTTFGLGNSAFTIDGIVNFDIGFTPFKIDNGSSLGGLVRLSGAFSYTDIGDWYFDEYYDGYYMGNDALHASGTTMWFAISPMIAGRFQVDRATVIVLAAGLSYYNYGDVTENVWDDDGYVSASETIPSTGIPGANGVTPAVLIQMYTNNFSIEGGLTGPDVYVGCGFAF